MNSYLSRRDAILSMGGGLGATALSSLLASSAYADDAISIHHPPKVKRVIQLFMNGGTFQGDFFDPKPKLNEFKIENEIPKQPFSFQVICQHN